MTSDNSLPSPYRLQASRAGDTLISKFLSLLACLAAVMSMHNAFGDNYCVRNSAELAAALRDVGHNNEADEIRLVEGLYSGKFRFTSTQRNDGLTIKGGYVLAEGGDSLAPTDSGRCIETTSDGDVDPTKTVLDGGNERRIGPPFPQLVSPRR